MRRWRLNSGYCGNTDQRRTKAGTIPALKNYMESRLWTPAQITTVLWLDAADDNTITLNGSTVSQWNDKSGNARNATQETEANQPTFTVNGLNNKPVLTFDGSNDFMTYSGITINDNNTFVFSVYNRTSAGIHTFDVASNVGAVNTTPRGYGNWWFTDNVLYSILRSGTGAVHGTASTTTGTFINCCARNNTGTQAWRNGTALGTRQASASSGNPTIQAIGQITTTAPTNFFYHNGFIAEIIFGRFDISDGDRQRVEGYLAHKWGLTSNLPAAHPYKNTAPLQE